MSGDPAPEAVLVDSRGTLCPQPVIDLARAAEGLPGGTELVVLADDPAAALDVPAWCRMRGHAYVGEETRSDGRAYRVRLG